ncbi:MAG TPA: cation:proton antiporter, partial [Verrucomicrobiae bacterium]|nr:cation:proton antiporter [Verrucomicrobiae bacterium]
MENHAAFHSLLLLTLLALAVPLVVRQIGRLVRVPIVVGEIIAGIAVGQSGLNLVHETPVVSFLADFGFIFLMFLSGLEVNFSAISEAGPVRAFRSVWHRPMWLAGLNFALTLILAT